MTWPNKLTLGEPWLPEDSTGTLTSQVARALLLKSEEIFYLFFCLDFCIFKGLYVLFFKVKLSSPISKAGWFL